MTGPRAGDAFGAALLAYLDRPEPDEMIVVERDDGHVRPIPTRVFFRADDEFYAVEREAAQHVHGDVLDVGAGAGPHARWLADEGHAVTVLDVSPGAIEVCRRRGLGDSFVGTVDEFAASTERRYDTFLLMGHNLGLLESRERAPVMLEAITALANPGAVILGTIGDPYPAAMPVHQEYQSRNRARGRLRGQVTMRVRYGDLAGDWFEYLYATVDDLEGLVAGTGWSIRHHHVDGGSAFVMLG